MKKVLIVVHVGRHLKLFSQADAWVCKELGFEVHFAANFNSEADKPRKEDEDAFILHQVDFARSPLSLDNLKAYKQLKRILLSNNFDLVHTHMAIAGVIGRLAANYSNVKSIIHTAHGFNFYKGSPFFKGILFKCIEKFMARYSNAIITMNQEDYEYATKHMQLRKNGRVYCIPGVGINTNKIRTTMMDKKSKKAEFGLNEDTFIFLTIGELIERKNYQTSIKAFAKAKCKNSVYLICGRGKLESTLRQQVSDLNVSDSVIFTGYRTDIPEIVNIADVFLFPSRQEGLPVSVMEAMSAGLPIIASEIRGNTDLINNEQNGFLLKPDDIDGFANAITKLYNDSEIRKEITDNNYKDIKKYDVNKVVEIMKKIYIEQTSK